MVALLPISMGALVTTLGAGMAFADWPSSDGQNMLLYPWFRDFADHPEKFVEHGHRLAGVIIGIVSIALFTAALVLERNWVKTFAAMILVSVVVQGAIGGARVLLDQRVLAMTHSLTGGAFFSLCVVFRLMCSKGWPRWNQQPDRRLTPLAAAIVAITPVALVAQYFLGSLLRHFHMMLDEHLIGAAVVSLIGCSAAVFLLRSENTLLRRCGLAIASVLMLQLMLGTGAYLTRFGLPLIGFVATMGSASQAVLCSLHTVFGMLLLASSVAGTASFVVLYRAGMLRGLRIEMSALSDRGTFT